MCGRLDVTKTHGKILRFLNLSRSCPGMQLGLYEFEMALANLPHRFTWDLPDGMKPSEVDTDDVFGLTAHKATRLVSVPNPSLLCLL
ncbi:hypothetical protein RND71_020445 [Anisodus tanguticus]|uniref:Uncharacterized protein n=1 Tax=Anisodus tanguticus TaxID=243964 RepID=A0AAE1V9E1_9SOLA|nr:hypothetical protein RND71_020445 [Anisodus tanguticus]